MTATDRLRELLEERGVEWEALPDQQEGDLTITITRWYDGEGGLLTMLISEPHGSTWDFFWLPTPEQAIAATLGREPDDDAMVKLHDQMNAVLLEYERAQGIERRDGDGEIVVPFVAEMHRLLEEAATLESGTCHMKEVNLPTFGGHDDGYFIVCSECAFAIYERRSWSSIKYCPNCGRRVVEVG